MAPVPIRALRVSFTANVNQEDIMRTLKEMIVNNQTVRFSFYRDGQLWDETECGFRFPVPIEGLYGQTELLPTNSYALYPSSSSCKISADPIQPTITVCEAP
jgi:hypothetical protein